jgi:hypothetical protein
MANIPSLQGQWESTYFYTSRQSKNELVGRHRVEFSRKGNTLVGKSLAGDSDSQLGLVLEIDGSVLRGTWTEQTSSRGEYKGQSFKGSVELVLDDDLAAATGLWLGANRDHTSIKSGRWELKRAT